MILKTIRKQANLKGFTLIETLIYLALFAIIIGGGLVAVYQIIESTNKTNQKVIVAEEANFLLRKIDYALNGATILTVGGSAGNSNLIITRPGVNCLFFDLNTGTLRITDYPSPCSPVMGTTVPLSSSEVTVSTLDFVHTPPAGGKPAKLETSFTMNGQVFLETKYLRQ